MSSTTPKTKPAKMPKVLFVITIIVIVGYVLYQQGYIPKVAMAPQGEDAILKHVRDIIEVDVSKNNEFIVNEEQLVWVSEDGIKALSLEGEEIWADTHTMKNIAITQRMPYFAISEKMGRTISMFDSHGKKADIKFANPVVCFSMNKNGDMVVIEKTTDGHVVSAYDKQGNSLGLKRITYVQDVGYPTAAEISPDGKMIFVSYLNISDAQIVSNMIAIAIGNDGLTKVDSILYGTAYSNTVLSEIEFMSENVWVAIGDNGISFNTLAGEEIKKIGDTYCNYVSILDRVIDWQGVHYATISSTKPTRSTVHPVETLVLYSQDGEEVTEMILKEPTTYLYGDGKTIIVGSDRKFTAYNRLGKKRWEYTATKDVQKMIPLHPGQQVIMASKGKVELMQVVK